MKNLLVAACAIALGFIVMDGTQIVKAPTGLIVKPGQAVAAELPVPPPVGKGKAPIGKGKGKAPVPPIVTKG